MQVFKLCSTVDLFSDTVIGHTFSVINSGTKNFYKISSKFQVPIQYLLLNFQSSCNITIAFTAIF